MSLEPRPGQPSSPGARSTRGPQRAQGSVDNPQRPARALYGALPIAFSLVGAALLFAHHGYTFQLNDQLQYLLLPYRDIYPQFAPGDWFTWQTSHYHISYSLLVRALHAVAGEGHFREALLGAHLLCLASLCFAMLRLSQASGSGYLGAGMALLVLAWVRHEAIADATFNHAQLVPSDMALPPLLLGASAWLLGRYRAAGLWLGLSGLLHSNYAVLGPLLLGAAEWLGVPPEARPRWRPRLEACLGYLLVAAPSLWWIATAFIAGDGHAEAVDIVFRIRSPHHYDLASLPSEDFWWPATLVLWALPTLVSQFQQARSRLRGLEVATACWLAVGLVGTWAGIGPVVRLFFWRLSPLLILLLLNAVALVWLDRVRSDRTLAVRVRAALWLLAGALTLAAFGRSDMAEIAPFGLSARYFGLPAAGTVALASLSLWRRSTLGVCVAMAPASALFAHALSAAPVPHMRAGMVRDPIMGGPRLGRFVWDEHHPNVKNQQLFAWIREHTPPDAQFLIPPSLISFRIRTHRAVFVDFKAAPMRGEEALEWQRRMLLAMGLHSFPATGYALRYQSGERYGRRPLRELEHLARAEGMQYIVAPRRPTPRPGDPSPGHLSLVMQDRQYAVYRVQ